MSVITNNSTQLHLPVPNNPLQSSETPSNLNRWMHHAALFLSRFRTCQLTPHSAISTARTKLQTRPMSAHTTPSTPQDSQVPFVAHNDVVPPNQDPTRILTDSDTPGAWEIQLIDCNANCASCCYAWCFPCFAGGEAAQAIGRSPVVVAFLLGVCYLGQWISTVMYRHGTIHEYYVTYYNYFYDEYDKTRVSVTEHATVWIPVAIACAVLYCCVVWKLRSMVRHFYRIPGSCCGDWCATFVCTCCAIAQMHHHKKMVAKKATEAVAVDTLPAYKQV